MLALIERLEMVETEYEKIKEENTFLQEYIGGLIKRNTASKAAR